MVQLDHNSCQQKALVGDLEDIRRLLDQKVGKGGQMKDRKDCRKEGLRKGN